MNNPNRVKAPILCAKHPSEVFSSRYHQDKLIILGSHSTEREEDERDLFNQAQAGDEELLYYFLKYHHMKVYTQEEIDLLNKLTKGGEKPLRFAEELLNEKTTDTSDQEAILPLPNLQGGDDLASLDQLTSLKGEGSYYLAKLTHLEPPRRGEEDSWMVRFDEVKGFKPLFSTLHW